MTKLIDELVAQRNRIAGDGGWTWVKGSPQWPLQCCAIIYDDGQFGQSYLTQAAQGALGEQLSIVSNNSGKRWWSLFSYNDGSATRQDILDLFDQTIEALSTETL